MSQLSNAKVSAQTAALHRRRERVFLVLAGLFLGTLAMLNILGISRFLVLASAGGEAGWQWGVPGEITFALAVGVCGPKVGTKGPTKSTLASA